MDLSSYSGVYEIRNLATGMSYIGSSVFMHDRFIRHRYKLRHNQHENKHLQNAWNKHGEQYFKFAPLLVCEPKETRRYEEMLLSTRNDVYNKTKSTTGPNAKYWTDEETRAIIELHATGRSMKVIGKLYNVADTTIRKLLKSNGVYTSLARNWKEDEIEEIKRMRSSGMTIKNIASRFGVSNDPILRLFRLLSLPTACRFKKP